MTAAGAVWTTPWADTPPLPLDWFEIDGDVAVEVLGRLDQADDGMQMGPFSGRHKVERMRAAVLPFYDQTLLIDIQVTPPAGETGPSAIASALYGPNGAKWLEGDALAIHLQNSDGLDLSAEANALAYLRFFCAFVRGQNSPFLILDSANDLDFPEEFSAEDRAEVAALITPPTMEMKDENWLGTTVVLYSGNLFAAVFAIEPSGMVKMVEDTHASQPPGLRLRSYQGIYRMPPK